MTDRRTQIRDALGEHDDERLSVDDVAAMRRVVVASAALVDGPRNAASWFQPLAVAATLVAMIALGIAVGQRFDARAAAVMGTSGVDEGGRVVREPEHARQLHFSTPGGTRIIWIFNSDLDLKTTP
jgi:hypothetical protein